MTDKRGASHSPRLAIEPCAIGVYPSLGQAPRAHQPTRQINCCFVCVQITGLVTAPPLFYTLVNFALPLRANTHSRSCLKLLVFQAPLHFQPVMMWLLFPSQHSLQVITKPRVLLGQVLCRATAMAPLNRANNPGGTRASQVSNLLSKLFWRRLCRVRTASATGETPVVVLPGLS